MFLWKLTCRHRGLYRSDADDARRAASGAVERVRRNAAFQETSLVQLVRFVFSFCSLHQARGAAPARAETACVLVTHDCGWPSVVADLAWAVLGDAVPWRVSRV